MAGDVKIRTGEDYAKSGKIDAATFFGMREALGQAVIDMKAQAIGGAEEAKAALGRAVNHNELLNAAGTGALVKNYFHEVIDRQSDKDGSVKAFLAEINVSKKDTDLAYQQNLSPAQVEKLASMGGSFLKSAKKHLGIKTLTDDYQHEIREKKKLTDNVTIEPSALSENAARSLAQLEQNFRTADALDEKFFGNKMVSDKLARVDVATEKALGPIIAAATRLSKGKSTDVKADVKSIAEHAAQLTNGTAIAVGEISAEEGKAIGQQTLNAVTKIRQEKLGAESLQEIVSTKGKTPEEKHAARDTSRTGNDMGSLLAYLGNIVGELEKTLAGGGDLKTMMAAVTGSPRDTEVSVPSTPKDLTKTHTRET